MNTDAQADRDLSVLRPRLPSRGGPCRAAAPADFADVATAAGAAAAGAAAAFRRRGAFSLRTGKGS
jgi:hypothetical protein